MGHRPWNMAKGVCSGIQNGLEGAADDDGRGPPETAWHWGLEGCHVPGHTCVYGGREALCGCARHPPFPSPSSLTPQSASTRSQFQDGPRRQFTFPLRHGASGPGRLSDPLES